MPFSHGTRRGGTGGRRYDVIGPRQPTLDLLTRSALCGGEQLVTSPHSSCKPHIEGAPHPSNVTDTRAFAWMVDHRANPLAAIGIIGWGALGNEFFV